jgi:hypothetical protein
MNAHLQSVKNHLKHQTTTSSSNTKQTGKNRKTTNCHQQICSCQIKYIQFVQLNKQIKCFRKYLYVKELLFHHRHKVLQIHSFAFLLTLLSSTVLKTKWVKNVTN